MTASTPTRPVLSIARGFARMLLQVLPTEKPFRILSGPMRGYRWIPDSSVKSCWVGTYESEKTQQLAKHLRPGGVLYDIGAQAGYHSTFAASLAGPTGFVYAFEPLPRNQHYIEEHLALNGITNVELVKSAVSDQNGSLSFDPGPGFMAGHLQPGGSLTVSCLSLDSWVPASNHRPPTALKIDVEGSEMRVLQGAIGTIRTHRPIVMLDTHDFLGGGCAGLHKACCEFLHGLSYELTCSTPGDFASNILAIP